MKKYFWIAITSAAVFTSYTASALEDYAIIVDAGSTGSRVHLFQYNAEEKVPVIQDIFSEVTKPGLSSFAKNPEAAGASLKPLLDHVTQELKKNHINPDQVPVNVLATAGMRLLPADTQQAIYKNVSTYIRKNYPLTLGEIKTIPGKMEGLYGWLDVNYLLKNFASSKDITKGTLDMGGASTQIAFSTADSSKPEDEVTLHIGGNQYIVFSKSFLGLGIVQAFSDMNSYALASHCYPLNYPLNTTTMGSFNFSSCSSMYSDLIQKQQVAEQVLPLSASNFIAYSGIYHTYHFFNVEDNASEAVVEKQIQTVCGKTWEQLQQAYPHVPEKSLASSCANGAYLSHLLYNTYQLTGKNLTVTHQINKKDIDWTLGALLYQLVSAQVHAVTLASEQKNLTYCQ